MCALRTISRWTIFYLILWFVLIEGDLLSLIVGIPAACLAGSVTYRFDDGESWRWSLRGGTSFVWFFALELVRASIDVAVRAIALKVDLQPGWISYQTSLTSSHARIVLTKSINLLPGTVCGSIDDNLLSIHVLDARVSHDEGLLALESRIARMFREPIPETRRAPKAP